ncbi:anti-sigma factor [Paraburkholderia sp. MMS20-SJTR3]|uniref:Anti-sigma factor n=1 Tax=Paraburkholderia sejongensis TaxID=2886946 RepID=A0ABS8JMG5_9BURK|nr:anti-sigma factor [Paraburkholderia sp. MMS20-SJTR3]MCC8391100.1 anti-sigma factor [Paraburkholderia sp. MMS20-SJTR3]
MNTPANPDDDLQCAEYALGVLDSDSRRALERRADRDAILRATLDKWIERFAPLTDDLAPLEPPARVWTRIQRDLGFLPAASGPAAQARGGWWNNLAVWRWLGIGASAAALVLLALNLVTLRKEAQVPTAVVAQNNYMVATIARSDGVAHWTATVDVRRARMVVVPAVHPQVAADRSTELWLIAPNAKPIPLGVFPPDAPASMPLSPQILAQITSGAVLAVSLEPHGGSPTGQPTGPVLASGEIHAA